MLVNNYPDEDHSHQPVKRLDPDNLPAKPDPFLLRLYSESCRCGVIRFVTEKGKPATTWFLAPGWPTQVDKDGTAPDGN